MRPLEIYREPEAENPFLVFGKPDIGPSEADAVLNVLRSGWLSTGQVVSEFEKEFEYFIKNRGHAVAVSSCTDGLILSLLASEVGPGDEVITSPLTFAATVNAILAVGALPVFCDVDERGQLDAEKVKELFQGEHEIKAIIPVHYTGSSPDISALKQLAKDNGVILIEDAAHSFGGTYRGEPQGTHGDFSCFSFYATKNITCGEGGMVVCKSAEKAKLIRTMSMQGLSAGAHQRYGTGPAKKYQVALPGRKSNLSDLHASIGLAQLRRWRELRNWREIIWRIYESAFGHKEAGHSMHLYTIRHRDRDGLREFLHKNRIGTGIHFSPLHLEPGFSFLNVLKGDLPNAEVIGAETLSLPISSAMNVEDAFRVVDAVKQYGRGE